MMVIANLTRNESLPVVSLPRKWLVAVAVFLALGSGAVVRAADTGAAQNHLMYVGTLDHKLLVFDEDKEAVVGEIPLAGVPRTTVLSADQKTLYIVNTKMTIEIVDLTARKVVGTIDLTEEHTQPSISSDNVRNWMVGADSVPRFSGVAVDPGGHFLYATLRVVRKEKDEYILEPPKFVVVNLDTKTVQKSFDFPKGYDTGFGFLASFKVSPDGKYLYVFDEDIKIFDLATFTVVDSIPLSKPPYPGASAYRLAAMNDPNDDKTTVSSVFVSVDPIVHKGTVGLASLNMLTREVKYTPIGPALPMMGFMLSPDRKLGYSVMYSGSSENRFTEWWVWDLETHQVIKKAPFDSRPTFSYGISSDGSKLYLYGSGSTIEVYNAKTLISEKVIFVNKDLTTDIVTLASSDKPAVVASQTQ
jgi:DNA-binding beta-propeller fold protein YncE